MPDFVDVFGFGVQELPGIDEMIKSTNITNLGLIREATNPLAKKERSIHVPKNVRIEWSL